MLSLAYSISADLKEKLAAADALRTRILTVPLLPKTELKLRWEMTIERLFGSLVLAGNVLGKTRIIKLLIARPKKLRPEEREALAYKQALDYIRQEWTGNPKMVTTGLLADLVGNLSHWTKEAALREFRLNEAKIKQLLEYLQTQGDHPIIQSAIIQYQLLTSPPFSDSRGRIARLLSYLFLVKYGYDIRGLVAPERAWRESEESYRRAIQTSLSHGQLTPFIEYVVATYLTSLEETLRDIGGARVYTEQPASFWELNDRQRQILVSLENPETTVANRQIQKLFKISQITASRDLTKLAILSLVYAHGKGRSVYYTRA